MVSCFAKTPSPCAQLLEPPDYREEWYVNAIGYLVPKFGTGPNCTFCRFPWHCEHWCPKKQPNPRKPLLFKSALGTKKGTADPRRPPKTGQPKQCTHYSRQGHTIDCRWDKNPTLNEQREA